MDQIDEAKWFKQEFPQEARAAAWSERDEASRQYFRRLHEGKVPRWAKPNEISWVEYELLRARHGADWEKSALSEQPRDLEIWLARERDKQSWRVIGDAKFSKGLRPEARRLAARRAYDRVERYLDSPNAPEFYEHELKRLIKQTFGVSADAFRYFIKKGHLPRTKRLK